MSLALSLLLTLTVGQVFEPPPQDPHASTRPESIYQVSWVDGAVIGASLLGTVIPNAYDSHIINERCPCDPSAVNAFDRSSVGNSNVSLGTVSDVAVLAVSAIPALQDVFDVGFTKPLFEDMTVYAEVLSVTGVIGTAAKFTVQRPLPATYGGDPKLLKTPGGYESFYSGHTASTMASLTYLAMTLRRRHGEMWWPWVAAVVVGASVGVERVYAGRHFPTDTVVGALVGSAVGITIPLLHQRTEGVGTFTAGPIKGGASVGWASQF